MCRRAKLKKNPPRAFYLKRKSGAGVLFNGVYKFKKAGGTLCTSRSAFNVFDVAFANAEKKNEREKMGRYED